MINDKMIYPINSPTEYGVRCNILSYFISCYVPSPKCGLSDFVRCSFHLVSTIISD